jgi:hypothetical protein
VGNAVLFVDNVGHSNAAESAGIVRLPAGGRIKRGAVQINAASFAGRVEHTSCELAQVAILVIETLGH